MTDQSLQSHSSLARAQRLEEAGLNAWPAQHTVLYDGWVLRISGGFTRRANSVTPLYPGALPLPEKIAACEAFYAAHSLPPIFRLTSRTAPAELDDELVARSYIHDAPTRVLTLDLAAWAESGEPLTSAPLAEWLAAYVQFSPRVNAADPAHQAIIERIATPIMLALLRDGDVPVAIGLAVLDGADVGLYDLVVDPARRNQGWGLRLCTDLIAWGRAQGAQSVYLQVMDENAPARHLYESKLGFELAYTYWYRMPQR